MSEQQASRSQVPPKREGGPRLYWRRHKRRGVEWAWADLRSLGGGRVSLQTADRTEAAERFGKSVTAAKAAKERRETDKADRTRLGLAPHDDRAIPTTLELYAARFLEWEARFARNRDDEPLSSHHIAQHERCLQRAVLFYCAEFPLGQITPKNIVAWMEGLMAMRIREGRAKSSASDSGPSASGEQVTTPARPARTMCSNHRRRHLHALSAMLDRAVFEEVIAANPARSVDKKQRPSPKTARRTAKLDAWEASVLIEASRRVVRTRPHLAVPFGIELIATLFYTGGRPAEILGLEVEDVDFDASVIHFRPNAWRRLKNRKSERTVPLWPGLRVVLAEYLNRRTAAEVIDGKPQYRLLFPSPISRPGDERMLDDVRKFCDAVSEGAGAAGWDGATFRPRMARHTYCLARLCTLKQGAPIPLKDVARELGHASVAMIDAVYSEVSASAPRRDAVTFDPAEFSGHTKAVKILRRLGVPIEAPVGTRDSEAAVTIGPVLP
jgi:integrase